MGAEKAVLSICPKWTDGQNAVFGIYRGEGKEVDEKKKGK